MSRHTRNWNLRRYALTALLLLPFTAVTAAADTITVFAAASLKSALDEIAPAFFDASGHKIVVSFAGSSTLARQIQAGAPADVFISANADWMDVLDADGLTKPHSRFDLAGNSLVLIAPADSADAPTPVDLSQSGSVASRLGGRPIAMALVRAVPAGIYGQEALQNLGHWRGVAGQVAQTDNVRAALRLVSVGETPLGVVYASDAMAEPKVVVVAKFPATTHAPIVYPVAAIVGGNAGATTTFLDYLKTKDVRSMLISHKFTVKGE